MQTLGDILREKREKQGISVKDVEKATSIRALYIQAIEDGNYSILPGEVYLKGFIRNYANFLSLNGQEMVDLYRKSQVPEAPAPAEPTKSERKQQAVKSGSNESGGSSGKWITAVIVTLVFAGATWLGVSFWSGSAPTPSAPPPKPVPQAQNQPVQPAPPPAAVPPKAPIPVTPTAKPVVLVAKYTEPAWTLVTADGKTIFEGTPKTGDSHTWSADRSITIRVGNGYGVEVTFNGQPQGKLGGDGEVLEKTFSAGAATTSIQKP